MSGWAVFALVVAAATATAALIGASIALDRLGSEVVSDLNRLASDIKADRRRSAIAPPSVKGGLS